MTATYPLEGGEARMKKPLSLQAQEKEAAFWEMIKKGSKGPGTVCHK
jgi:hypothetical protein